MNGSPALICIPDITGFTAFMSDVKFDSSRIVIPSLLNKIIYSNNVGFKVSEIEGDAVLFHKIGNLPSFNSLIEQCKQFYTGFNNAMIDFGKEYADNEDFKNLPERLGLKIIMHYGRIGMVKVDSHVKLIGEDVIISHKLLKNDIPNSEYVLLTQNLLDQYPDQITKNNIMKVATKGYVEYEHIGKVSYQYIATPDLFRNDFKNNKQKIKQNE